MLSSSYLLLGFGMFTLRYAFTLSIITKRQVNNLIVPIVIGQIEFIMQISISLTPDVMHTCALLSYNACKPVSEINRPEFLIPKYYSKQIYCIATI